MRLIVHFEDDRCRPRRFYGLSFYLAGNFLTNHARAYSQPDGPAFFTISQHSKSLRAIDSLASNISDSPYFVPVFPPNIFLWNKVHVLQASNEREIDDAFATLIQLRAGAFVISSDPFLNSQTKQLAALALGHAVPTIFQYR